MIQSLKENVYVLSHQAPDVTGASFFLDIANQGYPRTVIDSLFCNYIPRMNLVEDVVSGNMD